MRARASELEKGLAAGDLLLDANVILASSRMCAESVDEARRAGTVRMAAPRGRMAYLEVGGVLVAEGRIRRRAGRRVFIVTRAYDGPGEAAI